MNNNMNNNITPEDEQRRKDELMRAVAEKNEELAKKKDDRFTPEEERYLFKKYGIPVLIGIAVLGILSTTYSFGGFDKLLYGESRSEKSERIQMEMDERNAQREAEAAVKKLEDEAKVERVKAINDAWDEEQKKQQQQAKANANAEAKIPSGKPTDVVIEKKPDGTTVITPVIEGPKTPDKPTPIPTPDSKPSTSPTPDKPKPEYKPEDIVKVEDKPANTEPPKGQEVVQKPKDPEKPSGSTPKDGTRRVVNGVEEIYIGGFGWGPVTGSVVTPIPDSDKWGTGEIIGY